MYLESAMKNRVFNSEVQKRPYIDPTWNSSIQSLLSRGWRHEVSNRWTMEEIARSLRDECVRARDGDESGLEHCRRRSTFVLDMGRPRNAAPLQ
jgi:hypothetical protein